jgi:RNA polymerase sigma-70 factor (ECF subfamily)
MPHAISASDLQFLLLEADSAARRLIRQLRLSRTELDDLRQDLLVDLIARLPAFDPQRGSLGAFANIVLGNHATRIAGRVKRERALFGAAPVSLDEELAESGGSSRRELIAEDEGLSAYFGQSVDAFAEVERRLDVERTLGVLDRRDGTLCAALSHTSVDRLVAQGRGSRSGLYRRVNELRHILTANGLQAS